MSQNPYDPPRAPVADMTPGLAAEQIYIARDGQKMGPYSMAEINGRLQSGAFSTADQAWHEGLPAWVPLADLLRGLQQPAPAVPPPRSGLARASLIIGVCMIVAWIVILTIAGVSYSSGARESSGVMIAVGLAMFAGAGANLLGLVLGIVALARPASNKATAVVGVALNVIALLAIALVMMIGLRATGR